jgi:nicotinate-nucleotide adenylyltransferase
LLNERRIGLFGGSFDPVHVAHLALARVAAQALRLHQLRWVPTGDPWHKDRTLTEASHRVAMLKLAVAGEPCWAVDEREIRRAGPSYTIDTVLELSAEQPGAQWFVVIGQDQYAQLHTWHRWQELLPRVTWAVAGRAGEPLQAPAPVAALPHRVQALALPPMHVSATDIRARRIRGEGIDGLVPPAVAAYIERNHLYRS